MIHNWLTMHFINLLGYPRIVQKLTVQKCTSASGRRLKMSFEETLFRSKFIYTPNCNCMRFPPDIQLVS